MGQLRIGKVQLRVLECLMEHKGWQPGCGWVWDTQGGTEKMMIKLVEKGLATVSDRQEYRISSNGLNALYQHNRIRVDHRHH